MDNRIFKVTGPDIVFEDFDGDLVVLNLATGRYFGFNSAAAAVWSVLLRNVSPARIAEAGIAREELAAFTRQLVEAGLIEGEEGDSAVLDADMRAMLATAEGTLLIESYDDLADLIVADPIHDTDEQVGWPKRRVDA